MREALPFTPWLDRFFADYHDARPVNATFIGAPGRDDRLPDFSDHGAGDVLARMEALLKESQRIDVSALCEAERLDLRLAQGFLRIQVWEYRSEHFHRGNPSTHTGEAVFGLIGLFLSDALPLAERTAAARARMEAIPGFLETARQALRGWASAWTERALRECAGARALLTDGVDRLMASEGIAEPGFRDAARRAERAFAAFAEWLERLPRGEEAKGCGAEAFDLYLREGHFLEGDADEIVRYAEAELAVARAHLDEHARDFGAASPEQALAGLQAAHPPADGYYRRYEELWREVRERAVDLDLLSWPERPLRFAPLPSWVREAAPYLYFLPYRAPAPERWPAVHHCLVPALDPGLAPAEQERLLRANNDSVIKLNYVVHHGGIGHHVQNACAAEARSRIGRVAAVDCASRIAFFCGGTMAEGWACYATDLAAEIGLLTPLEEYAERHTRLRMCARAVVDVRLHQGRLTPDEAARYYERQASLSPAAARGEAVKNSMFPGAAVMYLTGTDAIHELRREMSRRTGPGFRPRAFHDELLSYGSVPVSLVAALMKGQASDPRAGGC
jgi:uncharacterized protein (DUF885 family)